MNEEQSVLHFFAQPENLPLALSVADQVNEIRRNLNNRYWRELIPRLDSVLEKHSIHWTFSTTEDRNAPDCLVGVHSSPAAAPSIHLRLMLEQQFLGDAWRIYYGLMWSETPKPEHLALPDIAELRQSLQDANYRNNSSFLGWQWTAFHPRRRDFLMRYSMKPEEVLAETAQRLDELLDGRSEAIMRANAALSNVVPAKAISLDHLRPKK